MLWLVYGIPGTGKTLIGGIQDNLIPAVKAGRRVYTNITGLSVAGISAVANVPPARVRIDTVETVQDILSAFDSEDSTNSVFILDEMRQVLQGDAKMENWLSQRLNIMRKRSIDFVMIAQVPSYFSSELRELAQGCSLFKRAYAYGVKSHTREYRWNSGTPKIVGNKPQADGFLVRKIDPVYFTCYSSYIDSQIQGNEDRTNKAVSIWKSPKMIIAYAFIVFAICIVVFGIVMFGKIKSSASELGDAIVGKKAHPAEEFVQDSLTNTVGGYEKPDKHCYSWIVCDSLVCKTDVGAFALDSYVDGALLAPGGALLRCSGN